MKIGKYTFRITHIVLGLEESGIGFDLDVPERIEGPVDHLCVWRNAIIDQFHVEEGDRSDGDACEVPVEQFHAIFFTHVESSLVPSRGEFREIHLDSQDSRCSETRHVTDIIKHTFRP